MPNESGPLARGQYVTGITRNIVSLVTVIVADGGPGAPPGGGSPSGTPTRPPVGQLWPRGDGVPRSS